MNLQIGILITAVALSILSFVFSAYCAAKNKKSAKLLEELDLAIEEMENELITSRDLLEESKIRTSEQARRIAWLEARIRKPEKVKKDILDQQVLTPKPLETNMTERRHRVLSLASRGQDAETIASTLGLLKGEVELIMTIGRGSANFA